MASSRICNPSIRECQNAACYYKVPAAGKTQKSAVVDDCINTGVGTSLHCNGSSQDVAVTAAVTAAAVAVSLSSRSLGVTRLADASSGGGGICIQLYWRFSTGIPYLAALTQFILNNKIQKSVNQCPRFKSGN